MYPHAAQYDVIKLKSGRKSPAALNVNVMGDKGFTLPQPGHFGGFGGAWFGIYDGSSETVFLLRQPANVISSTR